MNVFDKHIADLKVICDKVVAEVERHKDIDANTTAQRHILEALQTSSRSEEKKIEALRTEAGQCQRTIDDVQARADEILRDARASADRIKSSARTEADRIIAEARAKHTAALQHLSS